jgi:hypothetical protein
MDPQQHVQNIHFARLEGLAQELDVFAAEALF